MQHHEGAVAVRQPAQLVIQQIAAALGYAGPVSVCDLTNLVSHLANDDTIYVEYRRDNGNPTSLCSIYYKRCSKMNFTDGTMAPGTPIQRPTGSGALVGARPTVVQSANVKETFWNNGQPHQVLPTQITTFQYP